jgi:hypothetical protein
MNNKQKAHLLFAETINIYRMPFASLTTSIHGGLVVAIMSQHMEHPHKLYLDK